MWSSDELGSMGVASEFLVSVRWIMACWYAVVEWWDNDQNHLYREIGQNPIPQCENIHLPLHSGLDVGVMKTFLISYIINKYYRFHYVGQYHLRNH